jgi:hypothetical protein
MPDALSRRADYHPGKGTTIDNQYNFVQALPKFSDNRQTLPKGYDNTTLLRALQRVVPINRDYFVDDQDLRDGLHLDPELAEIVADMSAVISIPIPIGINPHELPSVAKLRRTSRNPGIILPRWTNRQFLSFNDKIYVPNHNNSRLKILRARHDSPVAGHPGIVKTIELISRDYNWIGLRNDVETYIRGCAVCQRTKGANRLPSGKLKTLEVPT